MRVLIAEDDPVSRRILARRVEQSGYECVVAVDGQEALDVLEGDDPPRVALLDWMMPRVDGVEVCRRAREISKDRPFYLVLVTAKDREDDMVEGLDSGADDYVRKPYQWNELHARLRAGFRAVELQDRVIAAERDRVAVMTAVAAAHEMRQPLTVSVGTAELLMLDGSLPDGVREALSGIRDACVEASAVIDGMQGMESFASKEYTAGIDMVDLRLETSGA